MDRTTIYLHIQGIDSDLFEVDVWAGPTLDEAQQEETGNGRS